MGNFPTDRKKKNISVTFVGIVETMRVFLTCSLLLLFTKSFAYRRAINDSIGTDSIKKINMTLLPKSHIVPVWTANGTAHRISISKVTNNNNYIAGMGGVFPVVALRHKNKTLQFSVASSVYSQLIRPPGHLTVMTIDYYADFFFDLSIHKNIAFRFGSGHTSHHFSDDAIESLGYRSINYVRDYYQLFAVYKSPAIKGYAYGGAYYNYHFLVPHSVSNTFIYEIGFEHTPLELKKGLFLYIGMDIKLREELNFKTSENYQAGIKYQNESGRILRIAVNQRRGFEERGQFYNQTNNFTSLSAYFDF